MMTMPFQRPAMRRRVLLGGLCLAAAWAFYRQSVVPLQQSERENLSAIADLNERLGMAGETIKDVQAIEQQAARARVALHQLQLEQPAGSAFVWFPERMKQHFPRFGVPVAVTRLGAILDEPELRGFQRIYWAVGLDIEEGNRNVPGLLVAMAELEAEYPFLKVIDFAIRPNPEDPHRRAATVNIAVLVRK